MRVTLNGIVSRDEDVDIYAYFGMQAFGPGALRKALDEVPEGEELVLEVNSPGGSVYAGDELYSLLKGAKCRTVCEVQSLAASAASYFIQGADEVVMSPVAQLMVDILIATGGGNGTIKVNNVDVAVKGLAAMAYKAKVTEADLDAALEAVLTGKADKATTLAGYGITDAYTKEELNAKISAVYKPAGTAATFADLPELSKDVLGNVYNMGEDFVTTPDFVEGEGREYTKGTNVVVVQADDGYKFDVLAGIVDISGKVDKESGKGLSTNDYTTAEKNKLAGVTAGATKVEKSSTNGNIKINGTETVVYTLPSDVVHGAIATDDEVAAMLMEAFPGT